MDVEAILRRLKAAAEPQQLSLWENGEGRVILSVGAHDFVVVEDRLIPWRMKPSPQVLAASGFNSHRGMGA